MSLLERFISNLGQCLPSRKSLVRIYHDDFFHGDRLKSKEGTKPGGSQERERCSKEKGSDFKYLYPRNPSPATPPPKQSLDLPNLAQHSFCRHQGQDWIGKYGILCIKKIVHVSQHSIPLAEERTICCDLEILSTVT